MKVTSFEAVVEHGRISLPAGLDIPDRTKVYVVVPEPDTPSKPVILSPRLAHPEQAAEFTKTVFEDTADAGL